MSSKDIKEAETDLVKSTDVPGGQNASFEDQILLLLAGLMEGGQEDEETCKSLDKLTRLLSDEGPKKAGAKYPYEYIDTDIFETVMGYLDMRQPHIVRGHATLTVSAYLKASGDKGVDYLTQFFRDRVEKGTYDDYIVAFSVAASIFPIVPAICAQLFLSPGFIGSLGPLMKRKWKSRKVEQACLEMINAACMNTACREAIQKQCTGWLEEIVTAGEPHRFGEVDSTDHPPGLEDGPEQHRIHSENVVNLAAVVLAKLQAIPISATTPTGDHIKPLATSIELLMEKFVGMMDSSDPEARRSAMEGLAFSSFQPIIKNRLANNKEYLQNLKQEMSANFSHPEILYSGLNILLNLTHFQPKLSEAQKKLTQLAAYANATKPYQTVDTLNTDPYVKERCQQVFDAEFVTLFAAYGKNASPNSAALIAQIMLSLTGLKQHRGRLAQQGGIKLLLEVYNRIPKDNIAVRRTAAQALARILISVDPIVAFGGSSLPKNAVLPSLVSLLSDDPTTEEQNRLPAFESILALTNLASTDDSVRDSIVLLAWDQVETLLYLNNTGITRAVLELINNLMIGPECVAKFVSSSTRIHFLLAYMNDEEDEGIRLAAGGALAMLSPHELAVQKILNRDNAVQNIVNLCLDQNAGMRHRAIVCVLNILVQDGEIGDLGKRAVRAVNGVGVLIDSLDLNPESELRDLTLQAIGSAMTKEERAHWHQLWLPQRGVT